VEFFSLNIYVAKVDLNGKVHFRHQKHVSTSASAGEILTALFELIDNVILEIKKNNGVCYGIGLAAPSPVQNGIMRESIHFTNLCGIDLIPKIKQRYDCNVTMINNADAAAMAEDWYGQHENCNCLAYIWVEQGIGCGIIKNGTLMVGKQKVSNEFGHITIKADGDIPCFCGKKGCLTSYGSDRALARILLSYNETKDLVTTESNIMSIDYERLNHYLKENPDGKLAGQIDEIAHYFGVGIANFINIAVPDIIIVQGDLFAISFYFDSVKKHCQENIHPLFENSFEIINSSIGKNAVLIGAGMVLLNDLYSDPYLIQTLA
jgi:predicted NBD/HSP70 family sugar kinase